jgi:hypothetical protein
MAMCQRGVERVIGRLVTDDGYRRRFGRDPQAALEEMAGWEVNLTPGEARALAAIDPHRLGQCAEAIDPRLLKVEVETAAP